MQNYPFPTVILTLIKQVTQSMEDRMDALREFVPTAEANDWELAKAGQRVQVIKKDAEHGGILEFGTEIVPTYGVELIKNQVLAQKTQDWTHKMLQLLVDSLGVF